MKSQSGSRRGDDQRFYSGCFLLNGRPVRLADGLDVGYESEKGVKNDRVFTLSRWKDGVTITLDGKDYRRTKSACVCVEVDI